MWILFLGLLILTEAVADIIAKEYQLHAGAIRFIGAISAYVLANVFWLVALRSGAGLTKGAIFFSVGSAILAIVIGLVLYKESITTIQFVGVVLGFIAIILLVWE
jgi:multidrug transporter EmrE-like cation transporter